MAKVDRTDQRWRRLAAIAATRHGVVSTAELHACGLDDGAIHRAVRAGRLHRLLRRAYAVGHPGVGDRGWLHAALLSVGDRAVVSHRSAAALWGLTTVFPHVVDVLVAGDGRTRGRVRVHRTRQLPPEDVVVVEGLRVTAAERTLRDLRRASSPEAHRRLVREAQRRRLIGARGEALDLRSPLEVAFAELLAGTALPQPAFNAPLGGRVVDVLWPEHGLIVEVDGWQDHGLPEAFEDDRARDADHAALGLQTLRFTRAQVLRRPAWVVARLSATLAVRQTFAQREGASHTP